MKETSSSMANETPPAAEAKCHQCRGALESSSAYRTKRSPVLLCVRCAVRESFKGKYLIKQFCDGPCAICLEEKPTVHLTCQAGGAALIGHSFCKTCVLGIRPRKYFSNLDGDYGDNEDNEDYEDYGDYDDYDDDNSDKRRITEVKGQLPLRLPNLLPEERLLCPMCNGKIIYATKERATPESFQVTDTPSSESGFVIPESAVVIDLTSGDGDTSSRKRKRSEELSIQRKRGACMLNRCGGVEGHSRSEDGLEA